jgi:hypothetical protein
MLEPYTPRELATAIEILTLAQIIQPVSRRAFKKKV